MSTDSPDPVEVIAKELRLSGMSHEIAAQDAPDIIEALAQFGYRIVPEVDDDTRREVERVISVLRAECMEEPCDDDCPFVSAAELLCSAVLGETDGK